MSAGDAVPGMPGIVLERNGLGGLLVLQEGRKLGWIHEHGKTWHAYLRMDGVTGKFLGALTKTEAVRAIVDAAPPAL